jgi:hypothetical protein
MLGVARLLFCAYRWWCIVDVCLTCRIRQLGSYPHGLDTGPATTTEY